MSLRDDDYPGRYARSDTPWDSGKPSAELVRLLDEGRLPGRSALELGCGTGTNALELARRGLEVTAVDLTELAVRKARAKARKAKLKVDFRIADALKDDLGGPYDILFDRGLYHHLRHRLPAFQQVLRRVTRPGTWWLCLACNAGQAAAKDGPTPGVHEHELRAELGGLFDIAELREFRFTSNNRSPRYLGWSILMRRR